MKTTKLISSALALFILLTICCMPVMAADTSDYSAQTITYLPDGSYIVTTIEIEDTIQPFGTEKTISSKKTYRHYNDSNSLMWSFSVHGTFTYNGTSAKATSASYSYSINNPDWSFVGASASCSGATATATGIFKHGIFECPVTVSLTCSPTGVLS